MQSLCVFFGSSLVVSRSIVLLAPRKHCNNFDLEGLSCPVSPFDPDSKEGANEQVWQGTHVVLWGNLVDKVVSDEGNFLQPDVSLLLIQMIQELSPYLENIAL